MRRLSRTAPLEMMRLISNVSVSSQKKEEKKKPFFLKHALVNMHVFVHILQKPSVNTKLYLKISTSYIFNLEENVVIKRKRKKMATVPWKPLVTLQICAKFLLLLSAFNLTFGDYCIYHRFNVWLETSKRAVINFILFFTCAKCANFKWGLTGKEFQNNTTFFKLKKTKKTFTDLNEAQTHYNRWIR